MSLLTGLKRLGFTEYEAKVYMALISHPLSNGYEVSRFSGVPRAKVYEVLEGLVAAGKVLQETGQERTRYRALSYTALLQEHRRSTDLLLTDLYRDLSRQSQPDPIPSAVVVGGHARTLSRAVELITSARESLLVAGRSDELMAVGQALADATRRGLVVQALSRGPVRLSVSDLFVQHAKRSDASLFLLVDQSTLLVAELNSTEDTFAIITTARGIASAVGSLIRRDIATGEIERVVGERLGDLVPAVSLQQIQRLLRS